MLGDAIQLVDLVSAAELEEAWEWLLVHISVRPRSPGQFCWFDNKCWSDDVAHPNANDEYDKTCLMLARLYLASQFGDHHELAALIHGATALPILWTTGELDTVVSSVILNARRFRNHLSEHLSFWLRVGTEVLQRGRPGQAGAITFACSKPNIQPEDKGPDGLYIEVAPQNRVEVLSVKNSLRDPSSLVSSSRFRRTGIPTPTKLLDDFWLAAHSTDGLLRLEDLLMRTLNVLGTDANRELRLGLLKSNSYNAVVVADSAYANEALFEGYQHVTPDRDKRFATYIGATDWRSLAATTNRCVLEILTGAGLL